MKGWLRMLGLPRRSRAEEGAGRALLSREPSVQILMAGHAAALVVWRAMVQAAESEERHGG